MKFTKEDFDRINKGKSKNSFPIYASENNDNQPNLYENLNITEGVRELTGAPIGLKDYKDFAKYDVFLNDYISKEEAEKQRAKNQSWLEQTGRAVTQIVGNEIVLGTALGLSNLVDAVYNTIANEGYNDYTNVVSSQLEKWQDDIRERFEIYREDPNATFAIGDFGWWADNSISIFSTLSMAIPAFGVSKAISGLGKLTRLKNLYNKGIVGLAKVAKKTNLTNNSGRLAKAIDSSIDITNMALMNRTMENYMEAREVYNEVLNTYIDELNNMSDKDKEEFYKNNPEFIGLDNEEIAKRIASRSADKTFANDYAMLLMDIVQFKAIGSLWKGRRNIKANPKLNRINEQAATNLNNTVTDTAIENKDLINRLLKGSKSTVLEPLTELIEEGYQGIQTEKGKEVAKSIFDPLYTNRDLMSYLSDPIIWEQAFWGYLGGIGFQKIGGALGNAYRKVEGKINKKRLSPEEYKRSQMTFEKIRESEILGRRARLNDYNEQLSILSEGKNPLKPILEKGVITDYESVSENEVETVYQQLTNNLVVDMVLNAVDVGNADLLMDYITNPEFNKFFEHSGISFSTNINVADQLISKMNETRDLYETEIYKTLNSIDGDNDLVIRNIARENVKKHFQINSLTEQLNDIDTDIRTLDTDGQFSKYTDISDYQFGISLLLELNKEINNAYRLKNTDDIVKNKIIKELNERKAAIVKKLNNNLIVTELKTKDPNNIVIEADETWLLNTRDNEYYNDNFSSVPKAISDLIDKHSTISYQITDIAESIPNTKQQLQNRYNQINRILDVSVNKSLNDAFEKVGKYIETAKDPNQAFNDVLANKVSELSKEVELLDLGASDDLEYYYMLKEVRDEAINKLNKIKTDNNNNEKVNKEREEILKQHPVPNDETTKVKTTATEQAEQAVVSQNSASSFTGDTQKATVTQPAQIVEDQTVPGFEDTYDAGEALALQDATKIREALVVPDTGELGESDVFAAASLFALQMYKANKDLYKGLDGENFDTDNAKTLLEQLKNKLELEGYNKDLIESGAIRGLKSAIKHINNKLNRDGLPNLAAQIIDSKDVDAKNAITSSIPTAKLNEIIDKFLDEYIKSVGIKENKNGSVLIDIVQLFDYLINNSDIGYEQAKLIYINMYDYIINHTSNTTYNKYLFKNIRLVKNNYITSASFIKSLERAENFLQQIQFAKREYVTTNNKLRTAVANKVYKDSTARDIYYRLKPGDKLDIERNGKLLFFKKNGIEIGYSIIPTVSTDGNTLYMPKEKGFRYSITKNGNTYTSPYFDELFIKLAEQSDDVQDLLNILNIFASNIETGAIINESLENEDSDNLYTLLSEQSKKPFEHVNSKGVKISNLDGAKMIINHPIIKKLIDEGYIQVDAYNVVNSAKIIANEILSVLNYDKFATDSQSKIRSYKNWLASMYSNLQQTKDIADNVLDYKVTVETITTGTPITSPVTLPINSPELKFTYENNPIIGVLNSGTVSIEGSKTTHPSNGLNLRTMGMLIQGPDGKPAYALFTEERKVDKSNPIYNDLKEEIRNIIKERLSGGNFDEFTQKLSDLFGGNNRGYNNLFKGYSVSSTGDITVLAFKGRKDNYTLIAYRYKNDSNEESTAIRYYRNGDNTSNGQLLYRVDGNEKIIDDIVEEILSNTQYFKTFVGIRSQDIVNGKINNYISKRDGKLVITLNNKEYVYNSFAEFALKNNAFGTSQGVDRYGNYFEVGTKGFYIKAQKSSPVKENQQREIFTEDDLFPNNKENNTYSGREIAERAGIDKDIINVAEDLDLLPKKVKYSRKNTRAKAQTSKANILVFKNFVTAVNKDKYEAMRLLIHERLHQILESKVGEHKKEYVNEILDIYKEAKLAIESNPDKYGHLLSAFNTFLNPDTYFNYLDKSAQDYWNSRTKEERDALFAEEFLVESLTQKALIDALNEIKSTSDKAIIDKQAPKTLWQKIIDALIKIFGIKFDNIENNSILAREYNLFGNLFNDTISENKSTEQEIQTTESQEIQTTETQDTIITKNQIESIDDTSFSEFEDDIYAISDKINDISTNTAISVNEYVNNYSEQDKPLIARFVKNGWIKIVC